MSMVRFFLSLGILVAPVLGTGQTFKLELKDSLPYQVNEIYIDRLNQIYLFPSGTTDLIKFNEDLSLNQKVSSPFFSQYIFLDVKDPMKLLLYLAQFNNVNLYDESLAAIAEEYFADFSIESSVCFYSSTQLCFFANNRINIKNILDKSVQSGEQLFYPRKKLNQVSQIKSNGRDIYLLLPGIGLWHFNAFLNVESFLEDYDIECIELLDDQLYYLRKNTIFCRKDREIRDPEIFSSVRPLRRFTMNKKYLMIAHPDKTLRYRIL